MNATAAIIITPRCLTAHDVGVVLSHRGGDLGRGVRRMYRAGQLPAPIDATLSAQSWRWSPAVIDAYINPKAAA